MLFDPALAGPERRAQPPLQHRDRRPGVEHRQCGPAALQLSQTVSGRHHHPGRAVAGQQWTDLFRGRGVVQHHQDAPPLFGEGRERRRVEPGPLRHVHRDVLVSHAQGPQQTPQRRARCHPPGLVEAVQVLEEDPAGEPAPLAGGDGGVQRELRLADPGQAGDRRDGDGFRPGAVRGERLQHGAQCAVPSGERGGRCGESAEGGHDRRGEVQGDVPALDHRMEEHTAADAVARRTEPHLGPPPAAPA